MCYTVWFVVDVLDDYYNRSNACLFDFLSHFLERYLPALTVVLPRSPKKIIKPLFTLSSGEEMLKREIKGNAFKSSGFTKRYCKAWRKVVFFLNRIVGKKLITTDSVVGVCKYGSTRLP